MARCAHVTGVGVSASVSTLSVSIDGLIRVGTRRGRDVARPSPRFSDVGKAGQQRKLKGATKIVAKFTKS